MTSCVSDRSRCGAVRILISLKSLAQPSRHFVRVGSLCLWRGADSSRLSEILVKRSSELCGKSFYDDLARVGGVLKVRNVWGSWPRSCEKMLWRSWWGPCMNLGRSLWEDWCPWRVLAWSCTSPCQKILRRSWLDPLQQVLAWRACRCHVLEVLVWKIFWDALGRFSTQDLTRSSPAAAGPFMTILWDSLRGLGTKILVKVLYN